MAVETTAPLATENPARLERSTAARRLAGLRDPKGRQGHLRQRRHGRDSDEVELHPIRHQSMTPTPRRIAQNAPAVREDLGWTND